jgi:hypothetical protein
MVVMEEFKHFVIVKFKEGVVVEELTKGMEKLVSEIDLVKSFEWYVLCIYLIYYYLAQAFYFNKYKYKLYKNKHLKILGS